MTSANSKMTMPALNSIVTNIKKLSNVSDSGPPVLSPQKPLHNGLQEVCSRDYNKNTNEITDRKLSDESFIKLQNCRKMETDKNEVIYSSPTKTPTNIGINNSNSNTIYIQNNVTNNKNSIRISTGKNSLRDSNPSLKNSSPTINICINNHYSDNNETDGEDLSVWDTVREREQDANAVPDSTTTVVKEQPGAYCNGEDVLVENKDGRLYLGTVIAVDLPQNQVLVKFGDNTEIWSNMKELTRLSSSEPDSGPMCVVCKESRHKEHDRVITCDKCGRGYHQKCHNPKVLDRPDSVQRIWNCRRCVDQMQARRQSSSKLYRKESLKKSNTEILPAPSIAGKLPYDLNDLTWDFYHHSNTQQKYCYCGRPGDWSTQMLQCARCRQWFHEKCLSCLQYPLYCGDRFYVFSCSMCNLGTEFIRRLELKWADLVHLLLFNLTVYNSKTYYDLDSIILPYLNDNSHALQLPSKIQHVFQSELREQLLNALTSNRNRFKCGREIKKRVTIWGLRNRLPPPGPSVTIPFSGEITEDRLREVWAGNKRLQFLSPVVRTPLTNQSTQIQRSISYSKTVSNQMYSKLHKNQIKQDMVVPVDSTMINIMMGKAYLAVSHESNWENESVCSVNDIDSSEELDKDNVKKVFSENYIENEGSNKKDLKFNELNYKGGGFVKKTVPFPKGSYAKRKKLLNSTLCDNDGTDTIYNKKTRLRKSVQKLDLDLNTKVDVKEMDLLTPPTSVSLPPTPPASNVIGSNSNDSIENDFTEKSLDGSEDIAQFEIKESDIKTMLDNLKSELKKELCDSSDETSSRSTLDLIIPPPKNFQGKNNPFCTVPKSGKGGKKGSPKNKKKQSVVTAKATEPTRRLKRQLSEKDIKVRPNGEVKRQKFRRSRLAQLTENQPTASKSATFLPIRTDGKEWTQRALRSSFNNSNHTSQISNCVDYALNGRRLRQRQDGITYSDRARRGSGSVPATTGHAPSQTVKQKEVEVCMKDLKSSLNVYFGAMNRIKSGEKYTVKGKRVSRNGKLQYLIEWDGPS